MSREEKAEVSTKYFFDITELNRYVSYRNRYSGIQRVVSKIIKKVHSEFEAKENLYYTYFDGQEKKYKTGSLSRIADVIEEPQKLLLLGLGSNRAGGVSTLFEASLKKYKKNRVKYFYHYARLQFFYFMGTNRKLSKYGLSVEKIIETAKSFEDSKMSQDELFLCDFAKKGDKIFCLDSNWLNPLDDLISSKGKEVEIYVLIYDLIPMVCAWVCDPGISRAFVRWIKDTPLFATKYLTISNHVRNEMIGFLGDQDLDIPVFALPLAQQFELEKEPAKLSNAEGTSMAKDKPRLSAYYESHEDLNNLQHSTRKVVSTPYILCVGTIEIRKNPLRLLQAWKLLQEKHGFDIPRLVFAGHFGWYIEEFHLVMAQTGHMFGQVLVYQDPSDEELSFLYDNCLFTIMPSLSEGWGLPVGESLSHGKTAVVADNSSLPEVGGNFVEYCSATSVESIADAVWKLVSNPGRRLELEEKIATSDLRTWDDVARDFMSISGMSSSKANTGSPHPLSRHTPS